MITEKLVEKAARAAANSVGQADWRPFIPGARNVLAIMEVGFSHMAEDEAQPHTEAVPEPQKERQTFEQELRSLINCHSKENGSNTPDFLLAEYLNECLTTFNIFVNKREAWYGRDNVGPDRERTKSDDPAAVRVNYPNAKG